MLSVVGETSMNKNEIDNKLHSELESNSDSVELGIKLDDTHEDAKNADNLEVEAVKFYEKAANFDEDAFFRYDDLKKRFTK